VRIEAVWETRIARFGDGVPRLSLVLFFVGFGLCKITPQEAAAVRPSMAHSPFLFWVNGAALIGVVEISLGILIARRYVRPLLSAPANPVIAATMSRTAVP